MANPNTPVADGGPIDPTVVSIVRWMADKGYTPQEIATTLQSGTQLQQRLNDMRQGGQ